MRPRWTPHQRKTRPFKPCGTASIVAVAIELLVFAGCGQQAATPPVEAKGSAADTFSHLSPASQPSEDKFVGSKSCRDCHAKFYEQWSASKHGTAMQLYSPQFAKAELKPQATDVVIGKQSYRAEIDADQGWIRETSGGKEIRYPIAHVMGGKNAYYFLTPMAKGRLQVLPVAYDVKKQLWYDTAGSGVRHFPDRRQQDEALPWTDRLFTFNTTCFDCHVSQLATNYDLAADTYRTTWREAGISCESCHGPGGDHARAMEAGVKGHSSKEIKIIRTSEFSHERMNDMCATCHAKMVPISTDFTAGDRFFDHYDLITLENQDFYSDGRDLGENYTFTSFCMSPCLKSGKLDCNQCHTPAGRPRYEGAQSNQSCTPCHAQIVANPSVHSHHKVESTGSSCIACHMPMTRFAAMGRTDHSMRAPTPAATIAFKSPNACNACHTDRDAAWADKTVRNWYPRDYQAEPLRRAALLDAARKSDWKRLPEMLADIGNKKCDAIYRNSLVRVLRGSASPQKWPVMIAALTDESPLVRASAAGSLEGYITEASLDALLRATDDPVRLVRIRAAAVLAPVRPDAVPDAQRRASLEKAIVEFQKAMASRPDDWASYSNLGGYWMESGDYASAVKAYETALKIEPRTIGPMVNAAMAYANVDEKEKAEAMLRRALATEPGNAAASFNLGLLLAETKRLDEAEKMLRAAFKADPQLFQAAYNLAVILGQEKKTAEAVQWCRKAHSLQPDDLKYAQTLAFYLRENGNEDEAVELLRKTIERTPLFLDGCELLADILERRGDRKAAAKVLRDAMEVKEFPARLRGAWQAHARELAK